MKVSILAACEQGVNALGMLLDVTTPRVLIME